jgi:hypothetical protein
VPAVLVVWLLVPGGARAGDDPPRSPADAFRAFAAALKKEDVKAAMAQTTRDSRAWLAGGTVLIAAYSREMSAGDQQNGPSRVAAIEAIFRRHGVSAEPADREKVVQDRDQVKAVLTLGEKVKDQPALVADFLTVRTRMTGPPVLKVFGDATIADAAIDAGTARSRMTVKAITWEFLGPDGAWSITEIALFAALEGCDTVYFKEEDGTWKVDLLETANNRPEPPAASPPKASAPVVITLPPVVVVRRCCFCRWCR